MQYLPAVSIITVEAESLTLLCLLALGRWSGALLELSCSLAVCFHRPPAFLKRQRPLPTVQGRRFFSMRARRSAASELHPSWFDTPFIYRSVLQQRNTLGHFHHDGAGDHIMPRKFLAVPAHPEKSEEHHQR